MEPIGAPNSHWVLPPGSLTRAVQSPAPDSKSSEKRAGTGPASEGAKAQGGAHRAAGAGEARTKPGRFDAHRVLGVGTSASTDEIRAAYRARMQEYHPDKVAHLGEDLQRLAHEKAREIQRAYQELSP